MRESILIPALMAALVLLSGCSSAGGADFGAIGDGISFLGVCFVVGMLVLVIGAARN